MKLLKLENCNNIKIRNGLSLEKFASSITKDMLNDSNENNKMLCLIAVDIKANVNPKLYYSENSMLYSLEFIAGKEEVILGVLKYECTDVSKLNSYLLNLVNDTHRKWEMTKLTYENEENGLTNQVLTLLRICKVSKEDYLKDPTVLSQKFTMKH